MKRRPSVLTKALSPKMMAKVMRTFDRASILVILICWSMTITTMVLALYTISMSAGAKKDAEAALATEPVLPELKHESVLGPEFRQMLERLQKRYPEVAFHWQNDALLVNGTSAAVYRQWLTAIGQIDTLYPQFHWKVRSMCIGKNCPDTSVLMSIELTGERLSFSMPQTKEKE